MAVKKSPDVLSFVGKRVKWDTKSRGHERTLSGKALAVIPAGKDATRFLPKGTVRYKLRASERASFPRLLIYDEETDRFNAPRALPESFRLR